MYGRPISLDDGTHLDGGIKEDSDWQQCWKQIVGLPTQHYHVPKGRIGTQFIKTLAGVFGGIQKQSWNAERVLVFCVVVLQRSPEVKRARDI